MRTSTPSHPRSRAYAARCTTISTGLVLLAGCSVSVQPFPAGDDGDRRRARGRPFGSPGSTTAAELDRDDDGRLDLSAPLRHGISFEVDERHDMVVDGTTVCVDGPGGTVTHGPC
jgi:hypothetical protein